jgi:hypothetical protein
MTCLPLLALVLLTACAPAKRDPEAAQAPRGMQADRFATARVPQPLSLTARSQCRMLQTGRAC